MKATMWMIAALALILGGRSEAQEQPGTQSGVIAAGWCAVDIGKDDEEAEEKRPGCDIGVGAAAYRWRRAALVGAIGSNTLGGGVAWVATDGEERGPTIAFSLGLVAPYTFEDGIDLDLWAPALGATFGFGGR